MNNFELNIKTLRDIAPSLLLASATAATLVACSSPAEQAASNSEPTHRFNPVSASNSNENVKPDTNAQEVFIDPNTGIVEVLADTSSVFPENTANSSAYFCAEAPAGQVELIQEFANNPLVRERLLSMGLNPNNPHFLSDQPLPISKTEDLYLQAGFTPAEAAKLADPKAQMSPYVVNGKVSLASVSFTGGDNVLSDPDLYEREGLYNENQRLVWPIVFDKVGQVGATMGGIRYSVMIPGDVADNLKSYASQDDGVGAANVDARCCQALQPGKPAPHAPKPAPTEEQVQPTPTETEAPAPTPTTPAAEVTPVAVAPNVPATPTVPAESTFPTCLGNLTNAEFEHQLNLRGSSLNEYQSLQEAANALARAACVPSPTPTSTPGHSNGGGSGPGPTATNTSVPGATATSTETAGPTATPTETPGPGTPTAAPTATLIATQTPVNTPTINATGTPTARVENSPTSIATFVTATPEATETPVPAAKPTATLIATQTPVNTPTVAASTATPRAENSPTSIAKYVTATPKPTNVPTATPQPAAKPTATLVH